MRPPGLCKGRAKILTILQEALYVLPCTVHFLTILLNNLLILSWIQLHWATCDSSKLPDALLPQGLLPGIISDITVASSLPNFSSLIKLIFLVSPLDHSALIFNSTSIILSYFPPASNISGGSDSKESTCNAGDLCSTPGLGRSPEGEHGKLSILCLENPHGQRSLACYSSWGHKELDKTERLSTAQHNVPFILFILSPLYFPLPWESQTSNLAGRAECLFSVG